MSIFSHRDPKTHRPMHPCPVCMTYSALAAIGGLLVCMAIFQAVK